MMILVIILLFVLGAAFGAYRAGMLDALLSQVATSASQPTPAATAAAPAATVEPQRPSWSVNAEVLNVRGAPATDAPVVGTVRRNTVVTEIDRDSGWIKVQVDGPSGTLEGWLSSRMLNPVRPTDKP